MGEAIGQVLPLGVGVSLSPLPIIAVVLLLGTPRGRANGPAFLIGWIAGLVVVCAAVLLLAGGAGASENGEPAGWVAWVKLILAVLLLLLAVRTWRGRPRGDDEPTLPTWMASLDTFTTAKSLGIGAVLSGVNPKNLMLTLGAGAAIAPIGVAAGQQLIAIVVFIAVGSLGIAVPVVVYLVGGSDAEQRLSGWKDWMARHNAAIMAAVLLLLGTKLLGDAISGLAAG